MKRKTLPELKQDRNEIKTRRQTLADAIRERDLTDEEQKSFDEMCDQINALNKRIEMLEAMENDDDPDEEKPDGEKENDDDPDEEKPARSKTAKPAKRSHLDFGGRNISTSKTVNDSDKYSLKRALLLQHRGRRIDGLEGERSREIEVQRGEEAEGFFMPWDFKTRGKHRLKQRDFTTTTGTGAVGILVEAEFIELLRNRMVADELGVQIKHNIKGKYAVPRQSGASSFSVIGEGSSASGSNPTYDQVNFVPRTGTCQVNISRKSLFEMSIDAETAVEDDMLKVLAIGLDTQVLAATGSGANATGILYDSNAQVITLVNDTGNGADITFQDALNFESLLAQANADRGSIAFCTTPAVRSKLKQTPKINSGQVYPEFVWAPDNTINGYKALVTNEMPNGLTKGTSSTLNSMIYGNWEDAFLALWDGIDIVKNPYINVSSGAIQYNLFQEFDTQRRHSNSFVISTAVATV